MPPRYFSDLSRFELALLVAFVCLLVLGIGGTVWPDSDGDDSATAEAATEDTALEGGGRDRPRSSPSAEGEKLPVKVKSADPRLIDLHSSRSELGLPPKPGAHAPFTEKVLDEIRKDSLQMVGIRAEISAECEGGQVTVQEAQSTLCTVTYEGMQMTWNVYVEKVQGHASSDGQTIWYKIFPPDTGVLVAKSVYGEFWDSHHEWSKELRCDRIPPIKSVPLDEDTRYECQYFDTNRNPPRWVNEAVILGENGVYFQEIVF